MPDYDLSQEHELVRRTVREFAEERIAPVAEELDREHRFPYELVAELAELGLMGMPIPEEYGGAGTDTLSYAIAVEELTRVDSSVAITMCAHTSLGTQPVFLFGSDEQKQYTPAIATPRFRSLQDLHRRRILPATFEIRLCSRCCRNNRSDLRIRPDL